MNNMLYHCNSIIQYSNNPLKPNIYHYEHIQHPFEW